MAMRLARKHVLGSSVVSADWDILAAAGPPLPFSVHLWPGDLSALWTRAAPAQAGSVTFGQSGKDSLADMAVRLPGSRVKEFPGATHNVMGGATRGAFVEELKGLVDECGRREPVRTLL